MSLTFDAAFAGVPVMAILRGHGRDRTLALCARAWDLGLTVVEVPVMGEADLPVLRAAVAAGRERDRPVGAGTILTPEQLTAAVGAGAAFTVAPDLAADVLAAARTAGVPHLPGVATPGEVATAVRAGLTWLKAFPAAQLGAGWITALHGPFPAVRFVATGGIGAGNARAFLDAGAAVVAVGSALEDPAQLDRLAELLHPGA